MTKAQREFLLAWFGVALFTVVAWWLIVAGMAELIIWWTGA